MQTAAERMVIDQLAQHIASGQHGTRNALVSRAALHLQCSKQTVYSKLRSAGYGKARKPRTDKGNSKLSKGEAMHISAMMQGSKRQLGKEMLCAQDAMDISSANELLTVQVSTSTVHRRMRALQCHPRQLAKAEAHVQMRSLYPNHVWQLDASICVLYRLNNGKVGMMDERTFNERKPGALAKINNLRVMRYAVTDHTSGAVYCKYYNAAGEDQFTLFEFLMDAFHARKDQMMHGVPSMLVWDAGSANMAQTIQNLLTSLAVVHWAHKPNNPRAKGQVECVHNVIERKFEGRLSMMRVLSVEALNTHLDAWQTHFNATANHSRHKTTRWAKWQTIRAEQLRLCPPREICHQLMMGKKVTRKVTGHLAIPFVCKGYDPAQYSVKHIQSIRAGDEVTVIVNPYRLPNVFVVAVDAEGKTVYHECEPTALDVNGFGVNAPVFGERYQAPAERDVDKMRKEINQLAYGESDTLDAQNAKAKGRLMFGGKVDPMKNVNDAAKHLPSFMARKGSDLDVPLPMQIELKPLTHVEASQEMVIRLARALTIKENKFIRAAYPDGVPETELDALLHRIETLDHPEAMPQEKPKLFAIK
jgi:hypothetical protein